MSPSFLRSIRFRGVLALLAAAVVRCTPDVAACVALPGSSVYVLPHTEAISGRDVLAMALQGRAAPDAIRRSPAPAVP